MNRIKTVLPKSLEKAGFLSLPIAVLLVLFIAILSFRAWLTHGRHSEQLVISRQVAAKAAALLSALKDAENGQRGFLLTGREQYLEPYQNARVEVPAALSRLAAATVPRPDQAQRVAALRPLVAAKLEELKQTIELRRTQGPEAALAIVLSDQGKLLMDRIRGLCAEIQIVAYDRIAQQSKQARTSANQIGLVSSLGGAVLFLLLLLPTIAIQREARRRQQLIQELAQSGTAAKNARDWLRTTIASIGDGVIAADALGKVIFLNPVAQSLTGWEQEQAVGKPLEEIFIVQNEETGKPVENPVAKALREGKAVGLANHTELIAKDGRRIPIDDSAAPIRDADGRIYGVVLTFRDIVDRKRAEKEIEESTVALRRSVEFDEAIMINMGEGLYTVDAQGLLTFINPAAEKCLGWSFAELRGRKMHDMIHHHHPDGTIFPAAECPGLQVLKQGHNLVGHEDVFIRKDGTFFDVVYSSSPLRSTGEIFGLVVVFRDVSERKRLEQALRRSEQTYRAIGESIEYGVWVCNPDGRNTYASESFLKLVGLTQDQCSDFGWGSVLHPDDAAQTIAAWKECVLTKGPWNREHRFRGTDGQYHWTLARGVPIVDEQGEVICWAGINLDIDQVKAAEEALRRHERDLSAANRGLLRANEDLTHFAFAAGHDLQEPLRIITSYSQLLLKRLPGNLEGDAARCVDSITQGARRMQELLADLLAYTQVTADDGGGDANCVDLNLVFQKALQNCKSAIEDNQVDITSEELPIVYGYETHFVELFQNLISNAVKYRRKDDAPRVHVSVARTGGIWRLAVADNGIGIAPEHHWKIFGALKRLHGKEIPGTGMGLAICQRVIERYGGQIWVESQVNRGATFYCTVPVREETPSRPRNELRPGGLALTTLATRLHTNFHADRPFPFNRIFFSS
jgi:PAS domain S-box-containing protein